MLRYLIFPTLFLPLLFLACRENSAPLSSAKTPLVPSLAGSLEELSSISIRSGQHLLKIQSREGVWHVGAPHNVRAAGPALNLALSQLISTPQGQQLALSNADFARLQLLTSSEATSQTPTESIGVEVTLEFNELREPFQMVLGAVDLEKGSDEAHMFGDQLAARRYVRLLDSDKVYLTTASLTAWEPDPVYWVSNEFPAIGQLEYIEVTAADGFRWKASKTSSYSPVHLEPPHESFEATPNLISLFEIFFQYGFHDGVVPEEANSQNSQPDQPLYTVEAKDRFGGTYQIKVLRMQKIRQAKSAAEGLKPGAIAFSAPESGKSPDFVICRMEIQMPDADPRERSLIENTQGRDIAFIAGNFQIIEEITEKLKRHEKTE